MLSIENNDADADDDDTDTATLAPAAPGSTSRWPAVLAAVLAAANVAAVVFVGSRWATQMAGERNAGVPLMLAWPDAVAGVAWLLTAVFLVRGVHGGPGTARSVALGGLAACAAAVPASCQTAASGGERYANGFATWAATRVDAGAVRGWHAGLPVVTVPTPVPADQWPPAVAALAPGGVEQLPHGQGVVLQWGTPGTWGASRRVFVPGRAAGGAPPEDPHHLWRVVNEGVYAATQRPG